MEKAINTIDNLMEGMGRGMIYIGEDGNIKAYNRLAKEITGIILKNEHMHPEGNISEGDIIIIADNEIGNDDELAPKTLNLININDESVKKGCAIVAIGV